MISPHIRPIPRAQRNFIGAALAAVPLWVWIMGGTTVAATVPSFWSMFSGGGEPVGPDPKDITKATENIMIFAVAVIAIVAVIYLITKRKPAPQYIEVGS